MGVNKGNIIALVLLSTLLMLSCAEVPEEINHNVGGEVQVDFLLDKAIDVIEPFAEVGTGINPLIQDEEELYCNELGDCVTAGNFRKAADFLLRNINID